jgi:hypothetical protein
VLAAYIIRAMMTAANASETSANVYQITGRNNPKVIFILASVRI